MPAAGRRLLFLILLAGGGPAAAQLGYDRMIIAADPSPWLPSRQVSPPDFRMPRGDLRAPPGPGRSGLIAAMPIRENMTFGVGRFINSAPRARTHVEPEPRPAELRQRERGIAAVGVSIRF